MDNNNPPTTGDATGGVSAIEAMAIHEFAIGEPVVTSAGRGRLNQLPLAEDQIIFPEPVTP